MGTFTAQILVGRPHPNHDGINPTHHIYLSENDRPAWILRSENLLEGERGSIRKITWIPTVENMLEDALLMIAIHVSKNGKIIELAKDFSNNIEADWLEMYSDLEESQRQQLYQECRAIKNYPKIIISVFRGSSIENQLPVLAQYQMDVEVCCASYSRLFSARTNAAKIKGSLN